MRIMSAVLFVFAASCSTVPFQPPEPAYKLFSKHGVSEIEVRKAMLECGFSDPFIGRIDGKYDQFVLAGLCMEKDGFRFRVDDREGFCNGMKKSDNCNNDRQVPARSVERRLSGHYCRQFPAVEACQ